jgi:hypothetical protein
MIYHNLSQYILDIQWCQVSTSLSSVTVIWVLQSLKLTLSMRTMSVGIPSSRRWKVTDPVSEKFPSF